MLLEDYRVQNVPDVGQVLVSKDGALKRILARSDSGGCDDWVVRKELRVPWIFLILLYCS